MVSSLSSLADRNFVIAYLLPVILATFCLLATFRDVAAVATIWAVVLDADKFAALTLLVLALWTASILLMFLNLPLYRVLEGYYGPLASDFVVRRRNKRYTRELGALADCKPQDGADIKAQTVYAEALREFRARYPRDPLLLMPTRLGNVLRSAETYSKDVYGADSIAIWARIAAVTPDSLAKLIDSARAEMDFFVNAIFLSSAVSFVALVRFLKGLLESATPETFVGQFWSFLLVTVLGCALALVSYQFAILKARAWGELFRSTHDLYLPDLAKQLGYELPNKEDDRKKFWGKVNDLFLDQIAIKPDDWLAADRTETGEAKKNREIEIIVRSRKIGE